MHTEILDPKQIEIKDRLAKVFKKTFYLVGGTAIALHLGHRRSIDFDLFTLNPLNKYRLKQKLNTLQVRQQTLFEDMDQLHVILNEVKVTFFNYPWRIDHAFHPGIPFAIPSLLSLAAMKAFALGRRAKWKDYVDLYFIIKDHFSVEEISVKGEEIFGDQFAEKLFRQQLAFHWDIDYTEPVDYMVNPVPESEIREFLIEKAIRFM